MTQPAVEPNRHDSPVGPFCVVYEDHGWWRFLPLTYARPVYELVCGMGSLRGRLEATVGIDALWCRPGLADVPPDSPEKPLNQPLTRPALLLNGRGRWSGRPPLDPSEPPWVGVAGQDGPIACVWADAALASKLSPEVMQSAGDTEEALEGLPRRDVSPWVRLSEWPWELIHLHEAAMAEDWSMMDPQHAGRVEPGSYLMNGGSIHLGQGSRLWPCVVLDAEEGPIYIGENARVLPHSFIQGPAYVGAGSLIQPGAKLRDGAYVGPTCKAGGEIEASILHSFSNKQHDGFLGHSYVGSWVNIAADCINSDLKNTYGSIRVPILGRERQTDQIFMGSLIGDHAKIGINASLPTGAVIGFCSSVFAAFSPKFVPSFAWIAGTQVERYDPQRGLAVARKVLARRKRQLSPADEAVFLQAYELAARLEDRAAFPALSVEAGESG
jgi:UDP-N-acetylglucosamine diphosphorylase/glucosamine-1-phosphate N-acetyltransferase